jgi:hypothetical protein
MLGRLDDYPVHQTPEPLAHPASGDRNVYDRYFFNGFTRDGELCFGAALGLYPNRRVMDAAFSVVWRGRQHSLYASRLAPLERTETRVGPISVEVVEPLEALRLRVDANPHGIRADLLFRARCDAIEEPRVRRQQAGRTVMDSTRFTQFGHWQGAIEFAGERRTLAPPDALATRDRSWGIRPVGERETGPSSAPQFFWLWTPVQFDDVCVLAGLNEDAEGVRWHSHGALVPVRGVTGGAARALPRVQQRIRWQPGTRRVAALELVLDGDAGEPLELALEPVLTFQMLGLGYLHPEWGHGLWKGESALAVESWDTRELAPLDPRHLHVQQLCRARLGKRTGFGLCEQLVIGPHAPSGLTSLLDPAR